MAFRSIAVLLAVLGLALLAACGSDDDDSGGGGGSGGAAKLAIEVSEPAKGKVAFEAPESVQAGLVEITLRNSGKAPHAAQIVGVDGRHSVDEVIEKFLETPEGAPTPPWAHAVGGTVAGPGQTGTAIQTLEPGTYYIADVAEESSASKGGLAKLEVTGEGGGGELPQADASIVAKEYGFETSGLKPGKNRITFDNAGGEPHHAIAFPLNKGATVAEVKKVFASEEGPMGPPPFGQPVGTTVLDGGEKQVTDIELKRGTYALVCFIGDRAGGPPHVAKGMISELEVK